MIYRFIPLILTLLLIGCGGGSDSSSQPTIEPPPPPPSTSQPTSTTGVITGFGSVYIDGIEYETDSSTVSTDDNDNADENDLQIGMIVSLDGEVNDDGKTGTAHNIHYDEQIKGPLESIDLIANSLVILGQTVIYDDLTSLDNVVLELLIPGDFLEVSGFFNADNQLYATRIEKEGPSTTLKLQGEVSMLDTDLQTFMLAELTIDYSVAEFTNFTVEQLSDGQLVRVKGQPSSLIDRVFTISEIKLKETEDDHDGGHRRNLEGIITSFESSNSFTVNDIHVITDENTEFEHGDANALMLNIRIKVKGAYNDQGDLLANEVRIHQRTNLKVEGLVESIDLDLQQLTLLGVTFIVNEQTKMKDESDVHERFFDLADININDYVEVRGFIDNEGNTIASKLKRHNDHSDQETELKGTVSDITETSFVIVGIVVNTTTETTFENSQGDHVSQDAFFTELEDGMEVEVQGNDINGDFVASSVEIKSANDDDGHGHGHGHGQRTEFRGIIEELLEQSLIVSHHLVMITENTEFEVNDEDVTAEQFWQLVKVNDQVKVKGFKDGEGTITAKSIEIEEDDDDEGD